MQRKCEPHIAKVTCFQTPLGVRLNIGGYAQYAVHHIPVKDRHGMVPAGKFRPSGQHSGLFPLHQNLVLHIRHVEFSPAYYFQMPV